MITVGGSEDLKVKVKVKVKLTTLSLYRWLLQTFFTYSVPHCPTSIAYKLMIFPIDVVPVLCGTVFTTLSNSYVTFSCLLLIVN